MSSYLKRTCKYWLGNTVRILGLRPKTEIRLKPAKRTNIHLFINQTIFVSSSFWKNWLQNCIRKRRFCALVCPSKREHCLRTQTVGISFHLFLARTFQHSFHADFPHPGLTARSLSGSESCVPLTVLVCTNFMLCHIVELAYVT